MNIPHIMHERVILMDGTFLRNPVGIMYREAETPLDVTKYDLPSEKTPYGAVIYQFFEEVFRQLFDKYRNDPEMLQQKVLNFAQTCLDHPIPLLKTAGQGLQKQIEFVRARYEREGGLRDVLNGEPLPEDIAAVVAEKEARYFMSEHMWQPIRRIGVVLRTYPQVGTGLRPRIERAIPIYRAESHAPQIDQWLRELSGNFADYLGEQSEKI